MQRAEDAARAGFQADRVFQTNESQQRINDVLAEKAYFDDVVKYFNAKLKMFEGVEQALNPKDVKEQRGEDYEFYMSIQPEKQQLWDMLFDLNNQLVDIQNVLSDLEY